MSEQPAAPAGVDLARVALHNARQAAKAAGARAPKTTTRSKGRRPRGAGRDPLTLQAAISQLMDTRGWEAPAAGGSLLDQWPTIAPELAGKAAPVGFDASTGTLHLRPCSPAYATQLRMFGTQMVARINAKTGRQAVRALHVLPPGPIPDPGPATGTAGALEEPPARTAPRPRTRDDAADGYHRALAAAQAHRPPRRTDPALAAAIARQTAAQAREPEERFTAARDAEREQQAATGGGSDAEAVRQAAIKRARTERAGRVPAVPTLFGRTA